MENKFILRATYVFAGLFILMALYFTYYMNFESRDNLNNSYNKLVEKLGETTIKGKIYSSDGQVLAESKTDAQGNQWRYYPYKEVFCHVIGSEEGGGYGVEDMYNYQMYSSDYSWINKVIDDLSGKKYEGNNCLTTLDVSLQQTAYNALAPYMGAVVVMEADTGKILTMVSNPSYNPNDAKDNWETITSDANAPILNRATMGLYTPGSIFKLFTLEAYLEQGNIADEYSFYCDGAVTVEDKNIGCAVKSGHGHVGIKDAFSQSCNGAFIDMGSVLNIDGYTDVCNRLLFNTELPLDMPYKQSVFSLQKDADAFLKAQTYFGQGETLVTPIHMCMVASAIANNGILMEPMLVEKIENAYGTTVETYEPTEYKELFTEKQSEVLQEYMRAVVTDGTAVRLNQYENLTVYGKTGTGQIGTGETANSWFMGYAYKDDKAYAIAVVCENVPSNISPSIIVARDVLKVLD